MEDLDYGHIWTGKWEWKTDTDSRSDYVQIRSPVYLPHSAGRYAVKRFRKAQCPIIERLTNSLMMNGRNSGKKLLAVRIIAHAFEIVSSLIYHQPIEDV